MSEFIEVDNAGQLIAETNYWGSEMERAGKVYCAVNAGAVRLLLPRSMYSLVDECRTAQYVILSRGPWPAKGVEDAVELLFEDGTANPCALQLTGDSFDVLPGEPSPGSEWLLSVWTRETKRPEVAMQFPCKWRRSRRLPDLSRWS
jgi:hypothetical protein